MRRTVSSFLATAMVAAVAAVATPATAEVPDPCLGAPRAPYVDVADDHAHAAAIDCLHGLEVIRGRVVDAFSPGAALQRDQMATIIAGAIEAAGGSLPPPDHDAFDDVATNVHRDAIGKLAAAGIVQGRTVGSYHPASLVPRGQMTIFLVRAHDHLLGASDEPAPDAFTDDDGHQHEAFIDRAAQLGLASGTSPTTFAPAVRVSRAQTATFAARLFTAASGGGIMSAEPWGFSSSITPLPASLRTQMTGGSWRRGCPVGLDDLRLLEVVHRGFDGRDRVGLMVLHAWRAASVERALRSAYTADFRIERMRLIDRYGADDDRSMADNNSSAFNCRAITGSTSYSQHSYGTAVDINPVQNPYVRGDTVLPSEGRAYLDRSDVRRGMIVSGGPLLRAFDAEGWVWGGRWDSLKDYQHFERRLGAG